MTIVKTTTTAEWEVTITEFTGTNGPCWKVTRRHPNQHLAETKTFQTKHAALEQYHAWLDKQ